MTDNVLAFERPPVRQSTIVRAGVEETFEVFVGRLAQWWPLDPFSYGGGDRVAHISVERRVGGRLIEHWHDGTAREWGTLLAWRPAFTTGWAHILASFTTMIESNLKDRQ